MEKKQELPFFGRLFQKAYNAVPIVNVNGVPVSFVVVSALFFISIRILANMVLESVFGWPVNDIDTTDRAASSIPAIVHSTLLCSGLFSAFVSHRYNPSEHISEANQAWQDLANALLQFCTGYMLNDTLFLIYRAMPNDSWVPDISSGDLMILAHHAITSTYMTQARVYKAGHMSAFICMFWGELSNPLHNTFWILEIASKVPTVYGPKLQAMMNVIPGIFSIIFITCRVFIGPSFFAHATWSLLFSKDGKKNLPLPVRIFWSTMIWAIVFGSVPEVLKCKKMATAFLNGTEQEL